MKHCTYMLCAGVMAAFVLTLGCSSSVKQNENINMNMQLANPITDMSVNDLAYEAGLKSIPLDGKIESSYKIATDPAVYCIDVNLNDKAFNIRFARNAGDSAEDISGVYLSDKNSKKEQYESKNSVLEPSFTVEWDNSYIKFYGLWNGYCFSVCAKQPADADKMKETAGKLVSQILSKDNLTE